MSIIGIVGEYNPFHNGHEYHIMMSKKQLGEDCPVVCVMSGDFVQRGEPAIFSKYARAEAAGLCGVDLVLELPLPWSLLSAESFASAAVMLLNGVGVTHLSFGSEAGEIEPLEKLARTLLDPSINDAVKDQLQENPNTSYAQARQEALEQRHGELAGQLELPNNILAVEYLKAIYDRHLELTPITVQRFGSMHDSYGVSGPKSASEVRKNIYNEKTISDAVPAAALAVYQREEKLGRGPVSVNSLETAILSRLRMLPESAFDALPDAKEGLGKRLYRAIGVEPTLDAVFAAAKTKRYALSRIRRMCMCAALGITTDLCTGIPPYARVLAANGRGCELLRSVEQSGELRVLTKPASVHEMGEECGKIFALGASAHDLYVLGNRAVEERRGGAEWRTTPKIVQE